MNTNDKISVGVLKNIATLSAMYSKHGCCTSDDFDSNDDFIRVDDAACLAVEAYKMAVERSTETVSVKELLDTLIYNFDTNDGRIVRIDYVENLIIERVNALVKYLYDDFIKSDCSQLVKANKDDIVGGLYDFFTVETDFEVIIIKSYDDRYIYISFVVDI